MLEATPLRPATCAAVDGAQTLSTAGQGRLLVMGGVSQYLDRRSQAQPNTNGYYGAAQSAQSAAKDHNTLFCSDLDHANGVCNAAPAVWQDRDQQAASLFGIKTYVPDDATAAQAYLVNLYAPIVPRAPSGSAANSVAGAALVAERRRYNAAVSLSNYVGSEVLASHAQTVQTLSQDLQRQQQLEGREATAQASWFEAMDLEINRHSSLAFQSSLQAMNADEIGRQIVQSQLLQTQILWATYKRLDQLTSVDATLLAYTADQKYSQAEKAESTMSMPQTKPGS